MQNITLEVKPLIACLEVISGILPTVSDKLKQPLVYISGDGSDNVLFSCIHYGEALRMHVKSTEPVKFETFSLKCKQFKKAVKVHSKLKNISLEVTESQLIINTKSMQIKLPVTHDTYTANTLYENMDSSNCIGKIYGTYDNLSSAISSVSIARDSDPMLLFSGMHIKSNPEYTEFVATNGHKLFRSVQYEVKCDRYLNVLVPCNIVNYLNKCLTLYGKTDEVTLEFFTGKFHVIMKDSDYVSTMDNKAGYVDYEKALSVPDKFITISVDKTSTLSSLKTISGFADKPEVHLSYSADTSELVMVINKQENNESITKVPVVESTLTEVPLSIWINSTYLYQALEFVSTKQAKLNFHYNDNKQFNRMEIFEIQDSKTHSHFIIMPLIK